MFTKLGGDRSWRSVGLVFQADGPHVAKLRGPTAIVCVDGRYHRGASVDVGDALHLIQADSVWMVMVQKPNTVTGLC